MRGALVDRTYCSEEWLGQLDAKCSKRSRAGDVSSSSGRTQTDSRRVAQASQRLIGINFMDLRQRRAAISGTMPELRGLA